MKTQREELEFRMLRRRAGEILSRRGNRLLLMEALIVLLLLIGVCTTISYAFFALSMWAAQDAVRSLLLAIVYVFVLAAMMLFLMLPMLYGLVFMACRMCADEETVLADLFQAFSSRTRYLRALRLGRAVFGWLLLIAAVILFTSFAFVLLLPPVLPVRLLCGVLTGMEGVGGLMLLLRYYPVPWGIVHMEELPYHEVCVLARQRVSDPLWHGWRYICGFLPWILLGLLSFGIFLLADVLPRMLLGYVVDCEHSAMYGVNENNETRG